MHVRYSFIFSGLFDKSHPLGSDEVFFSFLSHQTKSMLKILYYKNLEKSIIDAFRTPL